MIDRLQAFFTSRNYCLFAAGFNLASSAVLLMDRQWLVAFALASMSAALVARVASQKITILIDASGAVETQKE